MGSFSADLSVQTFATVFAFKAEPQRPAGCDYKIVAALYSHTVTGYHSLDQAPGECGGELVGVFPDGSHIFFQTSVCGLCDSVNGQHYRVDVLPDGEPEVKPGTTFGNPVPNRSPVSNGDGSRVFWSTTEEPKALYVRENDTQPQSPISEGKCIVPGDACTVQIDAAAQGAPGSGGRGLLWAASSDGSLVFFTDESKLTVGSTAAVGEPDLYEYDVNRGLLTDLTVAEAGSHANVQGVAGTGEDGSYVYYVADGVLTHGANAEGKEPVAGKPNLYMSHNGDTTFIVSEENSETSGGWTGYLGGRTADVAPGGRGVAFVSSAPLTGYDNKGLYRGNPIDLPEVFVYEAGTGRIFCASCNPSGAVPVPDAEVWEDQFGGVVGASGITDPGQISRLLTRLRRNGLIQDTGIGPAKGMARAWTLTERGENILQATGQV